MGEVRPLPLFVWLEQQRRARIAARLRARKLALRFAVGGAALALLGATIVSPPRPQLVWNASASVPIGLYRITPPGGLRHGDFVLVRLPPDVRRYAARRGYLPANVPAIKRLAAFAGDEVCARGPTLTIDDEPPILRRSVDGLGRPLPAWSGCRLLGPSEVLLLNDSAADSFDGRYFGPIARHRIIGQARLLWAR